MRPVPADWLALRREADHRARAHTAELIRCISQQLSPGPEGLWIVDIGAGTGSNQAWLAPRLPTPQHWILLDHDADLLDLSSTDDDADSAAGAINGSTMDMAHRSPSVTTRRVIGTVDTVPEILATIPASAPVLITCSALLDLLTADEVEQLVEAVKHCAQSHPCAVLLSLSVTGNVAITPPHRCDDTVTAAFDAHQRRGDLLGPQAVAATAEILSAHGFDVHHQATDWELGPAESSLIQRYLGDRAEVAVEQEPALRDTVQQWWDDRVTALDAGEVHVRVGHTDLVALPSDSA